MSWYKKSQYNQYSLPLDFEDKTDSPLFDDLTSEKEMSWFNPQTRQYKKGPKKDYFKEVKGYDSKIELMSPDEYINKCVQGFYEREASDKTFDQYKEEIIDFRRMSVDEKDVNLIEKYKQMWINGQNPPMLYIEYGNNNFYGQEGMHRALAAKDLGIKLIPVLIINRNH